MTKAIVVLLVLIFHLLALNEVVSLLLSTQFSNTRRQQQPCLHLHLPSRLITSSSPPTDLFTLQQRRHQPRNHIGPSSLSLFSGTESSFLSDLQNDQFKSMFDSVAATATTDDDKEKQQSPQRAEDGEVTTAETTTKKKKKAKKTSETTFEDLKNDIKPEPQEGDEGDEGEEEQEDSLVYREYTDEDRELEQKMRQIFGLKGRVPVPKQHKFGKRKGYVNFQYVIQQRAKELLTKEGKTVEEVKELISIPPNEYDVTTHASWRKICKTKKVNKKLHKKLSNRQYGRTQVISPALLGQQKFEKLRLKALRIKEEEWRNAGKEIVFDNQSLRKAVKMWFGRKNKALSLYGYMSQWNTSQVTDMSHLFEDKNEFNEDISQWDTRNVIMMHSMLKNCTAFNRRLDDWNVTNVKSMKHAFKGTMNERENEQRLVQRWLQETQQNREKDDITVDVGATAVATTATAAVTNSAAANAKLREAVNMWCTNRQKALSIYGPIGTWDTSDVTDMSALFANQHTFNDDISSWNTHNVKNMSYLFQHCHTFNQPLNTWNVSQVKTMKGMFSHAKSFNQPLNEWQVTKVESMQEMFLGALTFNQPLNTWDVSHVQRMRGMFEQAIAFNQPLNTWNVERVKCMNAMFQSTHSFNQPLDQWNVSRVQTMRKMFAGTKTFNQPLNSWNVSHVKDMSSMFANSESFNQPLNGWMLTHCQNISAMFFNAKAFQQSLIDWKLPLIEGDIHKIVYEPK